MVDRTHNTTDCSLSDAVTRLRTVADGLESDTPTIDVGNKRIRLSPRDNVTFETTVAERSKLIGTNREIVTLELSWKANGDR
ncbi:MAG: amphi-Trp domain-containing protein [Halobacteriota archaeon]